MKNTTVTRKIITIDAEQCNGCGLCVSACHEGAIGMKYGKAVLLRDDYCDGLGDCLPVCPANAITFEEREALPYDEEAVLANMGAAKLRPLAPMPERRAQWPVQIKLVPVKAPFFDEADLLVAADCSAFAYGNFHTEFMAGKVTIIGCPKLDAGDYAEKLAAIFTENSIKSVTVARMSVPCCGGLEQAARQAVGRALAASGKNIPLHVRTINTDGKIL